MASNAVTTDWHLPLDNDTHCCSFTSELVVTTETTPQNPTSSLELQDLTLVPCGLLWLMTPVYAVYVAKRPVYHSWKTFSKLGAFKLIAASALTLVAIYRLIYERVTHYDDSDTSLDVILSLVVIVTLILATVYTQWIFYKGLHTSLPLFVFWFLLLVAEITIVLSRAHPIPVLAFIELPLVALQFVLACIGDKTALETEKALTGRETGHAMRPRDKVPCPKESASTLSLGLFAWSIPDFIRGYRRTRQLSDVWSIMDDHSAEVNHSKFNREWRKELAKTVCDDNSMNMSDGIQEQQLCCHSKTSLNWSLVRAFVPYFCLDFLFVAGFIATSFLAPLLLRSLIRFIERHDPETSKGFTFAVGLFFLSYASNLCLEHHFDVACITSVKLTNALIAAIYRKALRITNAGCQELGVGYVVNMVGVDVECLVWTMDFLSFLWASPVIIMISMVLLWQQLGPSCLTGLLFLLLIIPINSVLVARKLKSSQKRMMKLKEKRLNWTSQILNGIRVLKLYAWENYFEKHLSEVRKQELLHLRTVNLLKSLTYSAWQASPVLVILVCFLTYVLSSEEHILDAEKTFVSIAVSNAMYFALGAFSHGINLAVQSLVSLRRIRGYLLQEELRKPPDHGECKDHAIFVKDGSFTWKKEVCLSNINMEIKQGKLVAVVGKVGSGKSSLLSALLGEMKTLSGSVGIQGSLAYVSQQAWIQNLTLRENILFSSNMQERKYEALLDACAMRPDLEVIAGGDMAEIGDKGINLSGGQKQRVSLARAVYSDRDIYLLDDPLSAVDAHVGKHIFDNVMGPDGILKDKTRLLVTHAISHLPHVDSIILMEDGRISSIGSFRELSNNETFVDCMTSATVKDSGAGTETCQSKINEKESTCPSSNQTKTKPVHSPKEVKSVAEEAIGIGQIRFSVIAFLIKAAGCFFPCMLLACMVLLTTSQCLTQLWLREWSQDQPVNGTQDEETILWRLGVFGGLSILQVLSIVGISTALAFGGMTASFNLHTKLLHSVVRSPMSFFDTTPTGRILNRFTRDLDATDQRMPFASQLTICGFLPLVSIVFIVAFALPECLAVVIPLLLILIMVKRVFGVNACQMQRIDAICRSPVYTFLEETIMGRSSIRAFNKQDKFIARMDDLLNRCGGAYFQLRTVSRIVCIVVQFLGNILPASTAILGLVLHLDSSTLGMAVSFSLQIGSLLAMCVCNMIRLETETVSAERVKEYSELNSEAPWEVSATEPPDAWPEEGTVEFQNYQTRYRPGLDLVLKGMNCLIRPGEKVGVVGRTGAGKTSLTLALFRMIEADSGTIQIDGRDISKMGLHDVRRRMSIIPQDPVVFSGTLRFNLDPSGQHPEHDVWNALEHAHLKRFVAALPDGLLHECGDGGGNLSVGQRQLICLARALLHKSKILVLDEATAAVDMDTDELIQSTIRTEFKNCTVITIAHRINSVMDYDRIMVMDDGYIREFDSPEKLTCDSTSIFYALAKEANVL